MKTILVAISGTSSDNSVLDAAYAIAHPLNAHLEFIHIPLSSIDVSDYNHHIEFADVGCPNCGNDVISAGHINHDRSQLASRRQAGFATSGGLAKSSAALAK
jgi:ribosomal protein S27AE